MKVCILHRYPANQIKSTNAAFPYLLIKGDVDIKTFKKFNRIGKFKLLKSLLWIFYAPFLVWRKGYDVIYLDDSFPFYGIGVRWASPKSKIVKRLGDLHLMYYCSGWVYKFFHWFERKEWLMMDKLLPISTTMESYIVNDLKIGRAKMTHTILDPVDPDDFDIPPLADIPHPPIVMFHGTLTRNKGIDVMLKAAELLPEVTFHIVGDGADRKRLQSIAPSNVYFFGWQRFQKIKEFINECDVGLALRASGGGNEYVVTSPFLQYSIMGKTCIVSHRKVFDDMLYSYQFYNAEDLADLIQVALRHPEVGRSNREYVIKHHNAKKIAEEIWSQLSS